MSLTSFMHASGRAAAIARRQALSAGKAALPPPAERVRTGERSASLPVPVPGSVASPVKHVVQAVAPNPISSGSARAAPAPAAPLPAMSSKPPASYMHASGRAAAVARRQALSAGKAALPPPTERVRSGERSAALPASLSGSAAPVRTAPAAAPEVATAPAGLPTSHRAMSGRQLSMARRSSLAAGKRGLQSSTASGSGVEVSPPGNAAGAGPRRSRASRQGELSYAPKVVDTKTHGRQTVTGVRLGAGSQVTGVEAGASLPVSGTQYIGSAEGAGARMGAPKVGWVRTPGGRIVSGSAIRSTVPVTGDEAGNRIAITGEADPRPADDVTERSVDGAYVSAQFQRQVDPHGHSIFGTNLGRRAATIGSRERRREAALESTEHGIPITGSAVGRAVRVTGDESGACRHLTGDQYLTPARAQAECGGGGGGTAPLQHIGAARRDPVTGAKVSVTETWARQRITGSNVEFTQGVTGDTPGTCAVLTGTPYHGRPAVETWCDPQAVAEANSRLAPRHSTSTVTGDAPIHAAHVSGTARGASRTISGTPYYRGAPCADECCASAPEAQGPVATLDARFSIKSPQRTAHLAADPALRDLPSAAERITGAFAIGQDKITGNLEFRYQPRRAPDKDTPAARQRLSGEGRTAGRAISGASWGEHPALTGTEGPAAAERNPSVRGGKPQSFAGAARFKNMAHKEEHKQLVTGMFGWSSKSAAKVTLSGGAQG